MIFLYMLAIIALLIGTAALYMAMIRIFPVEWLYYQYSVRKPVLWSMLIGSIAWVIWITVQTGVFPNWALPPVGLMGLATVLGYRAHQEHVFAALDFPLAASDPLTLPLDDTMQLAVVEYGGVTRAYPLDYVVHHHIVNDHFGGRIVSLTYCAMCRSIIPFDVTDIGPLFVSSFKNGNMVVADRKTKTWFQQASFESIIGELHPHKLTMIPFQILSWGDLKSLNPMPRVVQVSPEDLREFELPIPGVWEKIMASEVVPGLSATDRDNSLPARTHVIGIVDKASKTSLAYIKDDVKRRGIVHNQTLDIVLVATGDTVNCFAGSLAGKSLNLTLNANNTLSDSTVESTWDIRGKRIEGEFDLDLAPVAFSDEFWFSWKLFHPSSKLISEQ
jgi:hypothetical protein